MLKGIKLSHGVIFVSDGLLTVRVRKNGECGISPIAYEVLEWDLRCENPNSWDYMSEYELKALPDGLYDKITAVFEKTRKILG